MDVHERLRQGRTTLEPDRGKTYYTARSQLLFEYPRQSASHDLVLFRGWWEQRPPRLQLLYASERVGGRF